MTTSTRRSFIKRTTLASSGAILSPLILPSCSNWKGANDRLNIGHIGVGSRGWYEIKNYFLPRDEMRSVAVCDVRRNRIDQASDYIKKYYKAERGEKDFSCDVFSDFEELLERTDIDAVHIVTGDYWHLPLAIKALKAGKHVYLAKPLGLSYPLMKELAATEQKSGLVFQYGTQQRSFDHINLGIEMIREGKIGDITHIDVWAPGGSDGEAKIENIGDPVPEGFNYDKWLGPAPEKPYSEARCSIGGTWFIYDYALGFIAGWGAHPLDIAVMGAKERMDGGYSIKGEGKLWPEASIYDTLNSWDLHLKYDDGLSVHYVSDDQVGNMIKSHRKQNEGNGTTYYGEKGWISLSRWSAEASDPQLNKALNNFPKNDRGQISETYMHAANFAKVIKGEMAPNDPLDEAMMSDLISHLGNISIRSGSEMLWNPEQGKITNIPEANNLLHREMRSPYHTL